MLEMMMVPPKNADAEFSVTLELDTNSDLYPAYVSPDASPVAELPPLGSASPYVILLDDIGLVAIGAVIFAYTGPTATPTLVFVVPTGQSTEFIKRALYIDGSLLYVTDLDTVPFDTGFEFVTFVGFWVGPYVQDGQTVTVSIGKPMSLAELGAVRFNDSDVTGYLRDFSIGTFFGWGSLGVNVEAFYHAPGEGTGLALSVGQDAASLLSSFDLYVDDVYVPWGSFQSETVLWENPPAALQFQDGVSYELRLEG